MNISEVLINAATFLGAMFTGSGIVYVVLRAKFAELGELKRDIQELRDNRIAALEEAMKVLTQGGCNVAPRILEKMDNLLGWTKKMDGKLDRIAEETAAQRAEIAGQGKWLDNLDNSVQAHSRDRSIHHA